MEKTDHRAKARKALEQEYQQMIEDLLAQEEVENYFYEFRYEATQDHPVRYVIRTYPLWLEGLEERWENMRRLYEKGYEFFYRETKELVYDISTIKGMMNGSVTSQELFLALIPKLIIHAIGSPAEEVEWLCELLNKFQTDAMAIESMKPAICDDLRREYLSVFPSPGDYRELPLTDELKHEFAKRLPGYYQWLFGNE